MHLPLVAGATTFPHFVVGLWMLSHGAMSLQESIERFILPPLAGEVRHSRIGGGERSEPISRMLIKPYDTESKSRNVLASPLGEEGHEVAKGCTRVRMIMILDVDVTAERRHYNTHRPPKGETTHYILRVASAPSFSAVTDSLDFQAADAPLQIQFA